jgi:hypothetical protein
MVHQMSGKLLFTRYSNQAFKMSLYPKGDGNYDPLPHSIVSTAYWAVTDGRNAM